MRHHRIANFEQVAPDAASVRKQLPGTMQSGRRRVELEACPQSRLDELEELLALVQEHGIVHFPAQPGIEAQFARTLELGFGAVTDIQMEVGGKFGKFAPVLWLFGMDKNDVDVCCAAE